MIVDFISRPAVLAGALVLLSGILFVRLTPARAHRRPPASSTTRDHATVAIRDVVAKGSPRPARIAIGPSDRLFCLYDANFNGLVDPLPAPLDRYDGAANLVLVAQIVAQPEQQRKFVALHLSARRDGRVTPVSMWAGDLAGGAPMRTDARDLTGLELLEGSFVPGDWAGTIGSGFGRFRERGRLTGRAQARVRSGAGGEVRTADVELEFDVTLEPDRF